MKIWIITSIRLDRNDLPRASTIQNMRTATALAEQGHRVAIWVAGPAKDPVGWHQKWFERPPHENLAWLSYRPRGERFEKKTPFHRLDQRLWARFASRRLGAWSPDLALTRSPSILWQLRHYKLLPPQARLALEWQYPEWMQLWRGWRQRHPAIGTREAVERLRAWRRRELTWVHQADGVLYAALDHRRLLSEVNYARPAEWLPSGCEPPGVSTAGEKTRQADFEFGYVGTLSPENGIETILKALAMLPTGRLLLLGAGRHDYIRFLERQAQALGVADRVTWMDPVTPAKARGQMRRCQVGLVPLSRRAGPEKRQFASPLKLIEWLAAGTPVVASATPSVEGRVTHEKEALLVAPDDAESLQKAMRRMLAEDDLRRRLSENGRRLAEDSTFQARADRIIAFAKRLGAG
jgi:glycosyltransferase involved in cell wall biosynthesis